MQYWRFFKGTGVQQTGIPARISIESLFSKKLSASKAWAVALAASMSLCWMMVMNLLTMSSASDCWRQLSVGQTTSGQVTVSEEEDEDEEEAQSAQLGAADTAEARAREAAATRYFILTSFGKELVG